MERKNAAENVDALQLGTLWFRRAVIDLALPEVEATQVGSRLRKSM
jgi:hypothetical protein